MLVTLFDLSHPLTVGENDLSQIIIVYLVSGLGSITKMQFYNYIINYNGGGSEK